MKNSLSTGGIFILFNPDMNHPEPRMYSNIFIVNQHVNPFPQEVHVHSFPAFPYREFILSGYPLGQGEGWGQVVEIVTPMCSIVTRADDQEDMSTVGAYRGYSIALCITLRQPKYIDFSVLAFHHLEQREDHWVRGSLVERRFR